MPERNDMESATSLHATSVDLSSVFPGPSYIGGLYNTLALLHGKGPFLNLSFFVFLLAAQLCTPSCLLARLTWYVLVAWSRTQTCVLWLHSGTFMKWWLSWVGCFLPSSQRLLVGTRKWLCSTVYSIFTLQWTSSECDSYTNAYAMRRKPLCQRALLLEWIVFRSWDVMGLLCLAV